MRSRCLATVVAVAAAGCSGPSLSGPSLSGPSFSGPSVSGPSVSTSGVSGPSASGPSGAKASSPPSRASSTTSSVRSRRAERLTSSSWTATAAAAADSLLLGRVEEQLHDLLEGLVALELLGGASHLAALVEEDEAREAVRLVVRAEERVRGAHASDVELDLVLL